MIMKFLAGMALGGGLVLAGSMVPLHLWAPDGNSLALDVRGETLLQRDSQGGHPGTPLSVVRHNFPPDGFGAGVRLSTRTDSLPVEGFGGALQFQGTGATGERDMGGIGWRHQETPTQGEESPELFAWTLQEIDGQPRPFVHWSAGRDGVTFYAPECGWWDGNCWSYVNGEWVAEPGNYPRPLVRIGSAGVVDLIPPFRICEDCDK